jgi:hypothetical protein
VRSKIAVSLNVRTSLLALVVSALAVLWVAPAAYGAGGGFEKFFAGNCSTGHETCGEGAKEGSLAEAEAEGYRQAGGFVPFGVTDFVVNKYEANNKTFAPEPGSGFFAPVESLKNLRVDVAPGVVTNPQAVPKCAEGDFNGEPIAGKPGHFSPPTCSASTIIGVNKVKTVVPIGGGTFADAPLSGKVYNLEQASGQGSTYGVALVVGAGEVVHTIIKGTVEYASDYHDYFVINNLSAGLLESRLVFYGNENKETTAKVPFIRNPTKCTAPGPETTTTDRGEFETGAIAKRPYTSLVGSNECSVLNAKFGPTFALTPESALSDAPDGVTSELKAVHPAVSTELDSPDLETITVKGPEGLTMNPSAAAGLEGCTPEQAAANQPNTELKIAELQPIGCPSASRLGTVTLEVPTLPVGQLKGPVFLGKPAGKAIEGPPYTLYLDPESSRYGQRVLLKGTVTPNPTTGQLTVTFNENPQAPFNNAIVRFNGGGFAPLANPLVCGNTALLAESTAFSGGSFASASVFGTAGCPASGPPFVWTQSTSTLPPAGGANSQFTFNLSRNEGQQYLASTKVVLPPGLVGKIPAVTQCTEAQVLADEAQNIAGGCPLASKVGTVTATAGSGTPFAFTGTAYLTAPLKGEGAPYDILSVVPIVAGPVNLGYEVTRSKIEVNPNTARVVVTTPKIPTIRGGIPTRLRSLSFNITAQNYILNPTNCGVLATESTLTSTLGATQSLSSPFQVEGCGSLGFKPSFKATTSGKASKANGASLETTINQPGGQANIKSVLVQLPRQLPSRLTTLQKACPAATFAANPYTCPAGSLVGGARANTPVLPGKMTGPAYLVSHGGAAFPDLDLVLEANGVRVIVVGNTNIVKGITTTNFATTPDVPVTSITVNLPLGPHSALAANGNLCASSLVMPTTITGQNGKKVKQNTKIAISGCGVRIVGHKVVGTTAYLTVQTFAAGRISGTGANLASTFRSLRSPARTATLKVPLTSGGRSRHRPLKVRVRVGFVPKQKGAPSSAAFVTVTFR